MDVLKTVYSEITLTLIKNQKKLILAFSGLLRVVRWFETNMCSWKTWVLKMGQIGSPETSVLNHLTPRNSTAGGRIQFKEARGMSVRN
jgi:hypothetical protein